MKNPKLLIIAACAAFLYGCAATAPSELVNARQAYLEASEGPAAELAPAELHKAQVALERAETSFEKDSDSYVTRDLAYVAQRKAEMATAHATIATAQESAAKSDKDYQATQGEILNDSRNDLAKTRAELATAQQNADAAKAQLTSEKDARLAAEKNTSDAKDALARLVAVREDERGMILTLSGSVLFRSGESTLLPGSETKLSQVVDALSTMERHNLLVEGFTDSQGSDQYNLGLAQRRADAVRAFIVSRGYPSAQVRASGIGEGRPIADNATPEGRANNRRVEIVIERLTGR